MDAESLNSRGKIRIQPLAEIEHLHFPSSVHQKMYWKIAAESASQTLYVLTEDLPQHSSNVLWNTIPPVALVMSRRLELKLSVHVNM